MKSSRRIDTANPRRDSRDRDVSHASGSSRFSRKRPSMLSEFHGSKHYNRTREVDRESDQLHFRLHSRYVHDTTGSGVSSLDHAHSFPSSGSHSKSKPDSRSIRHSHHHNQHRSTSHHHRSNSHHHTNLSDGIPEEAVPAKRPRLMADVVLRRSTLDSPVGSSVITNSGHDAQLSSMSPPHTSGGLSAYLEDIDSDDDDSLLRDEEDKKFSKSPTPVPTGSPVNSIEDKPKTLGEKRGNSLVISQMPSKEELLMMMEKVDRDIAAAETQISALQKKQAELEETAKTASNTPHSSTFSSFSSPDVPVSDQASAAMLGMVGEDTPLSSPSPSNRTAPKKSQMDIIYSENKGKSRLAQNVLSLVNFPPLPGLTVVYHQPSEVPFYHLNLLSHQSFRPKLVQYIRRKKLEKHKKELSLCEKFDSQMAKWEKYVEHFETSPKKKLRDQKNRELFERCFPELKARREQQERLTRVDQRGYGIVRSDAELSEIMYELCEKEEAPVRYRRTHAVVPPMLIEDKEQRVKFYNNNGLISDPMALNRQSRFVNIWSEEEKAIFRDKYMFNPKNFEVIASFLPNKSPAECVQYYYLSKKREKFKHLVRKANLKRKKPFVKPSEFPNPNLLSSSLPPPITLLTSSKLKTEDMLSLESNRDNTIQSEFGDWSSEEISSLKEGLRKYGRAWGKIYREVGGRKTATQCKQFYDKNCSNKQLELSVALAEHSSMKNAEKLRRKAESRKPVSAVIAEAKRKAQKNRNKSHSHLLQGSEEIDSENTASGYESESNSDVSSSESTITDSSPEDGSSNSAFRSSQSKPSRSKKAKSCGYRRTSEEALDLFISAAEALNNIVPPEVALHDHSYALSPGSLVNNMELQGTSGLSLIAAAAAVVSPTLSRSAGGSKLPSLSPVRAPRGRPPNSQRKGTNSTASKLAPTLLSPAGSSPSVLLTEMKTTPLRGRARSAPSDRPKISTLHVPRTGSTLARMSINSSSRSLANRMPPSSYSRQKSELSNSLSLKSMIAFHPTTSTATSTNSTSAFEALVNVAVAAHPAELPRNASSHPLSLHTPPSSSSCSSSKSSSPVTTTAFTATPLSRSQNKDSVSIGISGSHNSNASNSGATAYIDVNQAINILASLAQQQASNSSNSGSSQSLSVLPNQRLFAQTPVNLLGNIMAQSSKGNPSGNLMSANLSTSKGVEALTVSATVDTLLGHLTSGIASQSASTKNTMGKGLNSKVKRTVTSKPEVARSNLSPVNNANRVPVSKGSNGGFNGGASVLTGSVPHSIQVTGSVDDMSNLNLLSSLVAAVAASQSTATPTSLQTTLTGTPLTTTPKASVGEPSDYRGSNKTELRRPSDSVVSPLSTTNKNVYPISQNDSRGSSVLSLMDGQAHTSITSQGTPSLFSKEKQQEQDREVDKLMRVSSSIVSGLPAADDLPRSVVRTGRGITASNELSMSNKQNSITVSSESDMTASLASIIPSYNPSMSSQSSLFLYTRSFSFPLSVVAEPSTEEEDHLESATRGISELSKLLGTDNSSESSGHNTRHENPVYKELSAWNPSDLLSNSTSLKSADKDFGSNLLEKSGKPYLSSLLESQIHGMVHHTPLTASNLTNSTVNSTQENREAGLDVDHSR